jgi:hypothetical protein
MTKTSWDIHQCPLAKRCRARWENLEPGMLRANVPQRLETAWSLRLARAARSPCAAM